MHYTETTRPSNAAESSGINDLLAQLKEGYSLTLPDKLRSLEELGPIFSPGNRPTREELLKIHGLIHKLNGSAGSYGFGEISQVAGPLERILADLVDGREDWGMVEGRARSQFSLVLSKLSQAIKGA